MSDATAREIVATLRKVAAEKRAIAVSYGSDAFHTYVSGQAEGLETAADLVEGALAEADTETQDRGGI